MDKLNNIELQQSNRGVTNGCFDGSKKQAFPNITNFYFNWDLARAVERWWFVLSIQPFIPQCQTHMAWMNNNCFSYSAVSTIVCCSFFPYFFPLRSAIVLNVERLCKHLVTTRMHDSVFVMRVPRMRVEERCWMQLAGGFKSALLLD